MSFTETKSKRKWLLSLLYLLTCVGQCLIDDGNPDGPCLPCKNFSKTSRKTIHRTPCFRKKISDVVLHRQGGLGLTRRWRGVELKDICEQPPNGKTKMIAFTSDICDKPIEVEVMRFEPRRGDVTKRYWTVVCGDKLVHRSKELAPFCLVDIQKTAAEFELYIEANWENAFLRHSTELLTHDDDGYLVDDESNAATDDASEHESFNSKSLRSDESVAKPDFIEKTHRVAYLHFLDLPVSTPNHCYMTRQSRLTCRTGQGPRRRELQHNGK